MWFAPNLNLTPLMISPEHQKQFWSRWAGAFDVLLLLASGPADAPSAACESGAMARLCSLVELYCADGKLNRSIEARAIWAGVSSALASLASTGAEIRMYLSQSMPPQALLTLSCSTPGRALHMKGRWDWTLAQR